MMKGKEGKGDRSSMQTSGRSGGGGGSVTETGALFPRLNVKETKRVGPRAPPRNKMALYEQFTFPSHRYVPPSLPLPASKPPSTYTPQRLSHEGSMFYGPVPTFGGMPGMPGMPWMPYSEMYTGSYFGGQPSVNGSSSSTVVDCEGDLRQGSGAPPSDTSRPSSSSEGRRSPWVSSHPNVESISSKKARIGNDQDRNNTDRAVPTYNLPAANSNGPSSLKAGADQNNPRSRHHQHGVESASVRQQGSISSHRHVESSRTHGEPRICSGGANGGVKKADKSCKAGNKGQGEEDLSDLPECTIAEKEKDSVVSRKSHKERLDSYNNSQAQYCNFKYQQMKGSQEDASSDVECVPSRANSNRECLTGMEDCRGQPSKVIHKAGSSFKYSQTRDSAHTNSTARDIARNEKAGSTHKHVQTMDSALTDAAARDTPQKEERRGFDSGKQQMLNKQTPDCKSTSSAGSGDDLEITSAAETSDVSQPDEGQSDRAESDAFDSEAETECGRILSKVAPRDIVNIIGEQEFWRARKLILRQQKIFSAQLFELHRIIKVQQLLAASPLTNEETVADTAAEMLEPDQVEQRAQDVEVVPQNVEAFPAAARKKPEDPNRKKQPDSSGQSSTSDRQCDLPSPPVVNSQSGQHSEAGQVPSLSNAAQGADSSASWGGQSYPEAGANTWFGAVPPPNAAYMYQPYPGSFPSPQVHHNMGPYNGAYPSVMCAPGGMDVPSMTPYGVPRFEQQPNLMQDMYRYNSYPPQQWPTPMCFPSVPPNPPGPGWCGVPVPMMNMTPGGPYGWYNHMAPGSHPSNYAGPSPQSNSQPVAAAFHPSSFATHSPWADSSNSHQQQQQQQQAVGEGEKFQAQGGPWPLPSENGRTTPGFQKPRTYGSSDGCVGAQNAQGEGGPGFGETSVITFQKPVQDTASQDCEVSGSQHAESGRSNGGWRRYERHDPRDSFGDPAEVSGADNRSDGENLDNLHKRNRGLRQKVDGSGNKNGVRQPLDGRKPADGEMDALPLFPMGPALKDCVESARPDNHIFPGVIKAVPRAMVATAESTAEILLSIQNQRQQ